jgi:hypothetical protein
MKIILENKNNENNSMKIKIMKIKNENTPIFDFRR